MGWRRPDNATLATYALAAIALLAARMLARVALRDVPHVMDEMAYLFEARTFLLGRVTLPVQAPRAAFAMWLVDDRFARYAVFPPGWPALLAPSLPLGLARWVNPALHGATVIVVGSIARRLAGPRAQALAAAVYGLSPQALLLAASLLSQTSVALAAAVVLDGGVVASARGLTVRRAIAGGAALAFVVATRPLCAVVLGLTLAALLGLGGRRGVLRAGSLLALLAPVLVGCVVLLAYNRAVTGHATRFPQTAYFEEHGPPVDLPGFRYRPGCNDLGIGPSHGCDAEPYTLKGALENTGENAKAWLLLAGGGPLIFAAALGGMVRARERRAAVATLLAVPLAVGLYALYWNAGTCLGARFYHAALPALAAAAGVGVDAVLARAKAAALAGGIAWLAWNAYALRAAEREVAADYFGTDDRFARLAASWDRGPAVVMVAFTRDGYPTRPTYRWTLDLKDVYFMNSVRALSALWLDAPLLDGPLVFAKYHPALVAELRGRFPDRAFFLYVVRDGAPGGDEVLPYDDRALGDAERAAPAPRDNFDGYVLPAPR